MDEPVVILSNQKMAVGIVVVQDLGTSLLHGARNITSAINAERLIIS